MSFKSFLLATALVLASPALVTPALAKFPKVNAERVSEHIKALSDDSFAGRGINTPAETMVIDYLSKAFAEAGFEPGGENGGWTQAVTLRKFILTNPKLTFKMPDGTTWSAAQGDDVVASTRGATGVVAFDAAPLVFVGYGVTAPERDWNDFKDVDVTGKIIVMLVNDPDFYAPETNTFGGKAMTYYGRWTYKYEEAARRGAAGVLIIHDTEAASYGWNTVRNSWTGDQFDIVRSDPSKASPKLEGWITGENAEKLFTAAGLDLAALKVQARSRDFVPVALTGVTLSGGYDIATSEIVTHNIIARLPGQTKPDETVLYTAHWDHLGVGAPDGNGDTIFNGAVDNGTGIAALIELAHMFKTGPKPQRSIVLMAVTAEESGLLGSEYYASNPVYPLAKTVGGINMDALKVSGRTRNLEVVGWGQSELEALIAPYVEQQNRVMTPEGNPAAGYFFRSDHFPLAKRGVPMLYAKSGYDLINGGEEAGKAADKDYRDKRYHQQDDEWSADWDLSGMAEDVSLYYRLGLKLANDKTWPNWLPASEFRAARDKSEAERK